MSDEAALWDWAVAAYARPGVEPLLLDLQDRQDHCIPYLLWVAWMARSGRSPADSVLRQGAATARDWDSRIVGPLRAVRRELRGGTHNALREQVKAAELNAEHALLAMLAACAGPTATAADLGAALVAGARAWAPGAQADELRTLARMLS